MDYDGLNALVTWAMLLIALPIFLVVVALSLAIVAPILVPYELVRWWRTREMRPR